MQLNFDQLTPNHNNKNLGLNDNSSSFNSGGNTSGIYHNFIGTSAQKNLSNTFLVEDANQERRSGGQFEESKGEIDELASGELCFDYVTISDI